VEDLFGKYKWAGIVRRGDEDPEEDEGSELEEELGQEGGPGIQD
jgi:hypothetical protein